MASTSVRWETILRFCELLQEHGDLDGVAVHPVYPGDKNVTPEMVVADAIEGTVEPSSFKPSRHHREDKFTVTWQVMIASQKRDPQAAMVRLFEVVAAFEDVCADSPTLGDLDGVVSCDVSSERQWPVATPEGSLSAAEVTISVHSYLE